MSDLIVDFYIDFLEKYKTKYHNDTSMSFYSRLSIFGGYTYSYKLILKDPDNISLHKQHLDVYETRDNITKYYLEYGYIVLRPYLGEKTLIVGCGRLKEIFSEDLGHDYLAKHQHNNEYTIDPELSMNPSICGQFGSCYYTHIPDLAFDSIIFEGFLWSTTPDYSLNILKELARILNEGGKILINSGFNPKPKIIKYNDSLISLCTGSPCNNFDDFLEATRK